MARAVPAIRMALLALGLAAACTGRPENSAPLRVTATPSGPDTRLTLHAEPGLKINARLAPALELADGTLLRFEAAGRTADSAYYTAPPRALLPGRHARVAGTLRASVCRDDEQVCRAVRVEIERPGQLPPPAPGRAAPTAPSRISARLVSGRRCHGGERTSSIVFVINQLRLATHGDPESRFTGIKRRATVGAAIPFGPAASRPRRDRDPLPAHDGYHITDPCTSLDSPHAVELPGARPPGLALSRRR